MKKTISVSLLIIITVVYFSCTKDKLQTNKAETYLSADMTQARFIHGLSSNSINTASPVVAATVPPNLNFFVNGIRLNGASTASTVGATNYGSAFPGSSGTTGAGGTIALAGSTNGNAVYDYAVFPGGIVRVAGALFRATGASAADTVVATTLNLESGKKYTVIAADTIPNQKFYAYEDNFSVPDTGNYSIRVINLAPNVPATLTAVDVYSRRKGGLLVSNVPYRSASAFISSPVTTNGVTTDTLEIRQTGSTTTLVQLNGFFPVRTRVYTFVVRGVSTLAAPRNLNVAGYLNR